MTKAAAAKEWTLSDWPDGSKRSFPVPSLSSSGLKTACNALAEGGNATYAAGAMDYPDWVVAASGADVFTWGTRFHHDETNQEFWVFGRGPGGDTAHHMRFVESTEAWTIEGNDLFGSLSGHAYDAFEFDPATQDQYWIRYASGFTGGTLWKYTESTNTWATTGQSVASADAAGLAWHPNLFGAGSGGIVECNITGIYAIDPGTPTRTLIQSVAGVGLSAHCMYDPDSDSVYCGGGEDGAREHWRVIDSETVVQLADLPIATGGSEDTGETGKIAVLMPSPWADGVLYLLGLDVSTVYYTSDNNGASWTNRGTHPLNLGGSSLVCSIRAYQAFWQLYKAGESVDSGSILWRPPSYR